MAVPEWLAAATALVLAPFVGSFLGVLADRAGADLSPLRGRSRCDHCGRTLAARDLVPVLSWVLAGGRSRCCGERLRIFHPAVEIGAFALTVWAVLTTSGLILIASVLLGWTLLALSLIDLKLMRLPDVGTLPLLIAGLAIASFGFAGPPWAHALGAAL
ncbi:MAG: prepilin peptidase, partial [Caulobacterales bacterium]|nr:prepilin peptidase [Caulobacterales bacterium]